MTLHLVEWRGVFRIVDERGRVVAVCETREEAEGYISAQA